MTKPKIGTHDSNHTNSHEEDDVDLLNMACQQELEERQQLLPDKSNLFLKLLLDDRKELNI